MFICGVILGLQRLTAVCWPSRIPPNRKQHINWDYLLGRQGLHSNQVWAE